MTPEEIDALQEVIRNIYVKSESTKKQDILWAKGGELKDALVKSLCDNKEKSSWDIWAERAGNLVDRIYIELAGYNDEPERQELSNNKYVFKDIISHIANTDVKYDNTPEGKDCQNRIDMVKSTSKYRGELKKAKTTFNSLEYGALIEKFDELDINGDRGDIKDIFLGDDNEKKQETKAQLDEVIELAKRYMTHKAKDGIKENAYPKMDKVIEIFEYCKEKGAQLGIYEKEKIDIRFDVDIDDSPEQRRNKYLARFAPENKKQKWLDKNEKLTKAVELRKSENEISGPLFKD